jgi:hypothetical protein
LRCDYLFTARDLLMLISSEMESGWSVKGKGKKRNENRGESDTKLPPQIAIEIINKKRWRRQRHVWSLLIIFRKRKRLFGGTPRCFDQEERESWKNRWDSLLRSLEIEFKTSSIIRS